MYMIQQVATKSCIHLFAASDCLFPEDLCTGVVAGAGKCEMRGCRALLSPTLHDYLKSLFPLLLSSLCNRRMKN